MTSGPWIGSRQKNTGLIEVSFDIINEVEKAYEVQTNDVVVSFHGVELDGEATRVSSLIREFSTKSHSGESNKGGCLFSHSGQEVGFLRLLLVTIAVQTVCEKLTVSSVTSLVHSKYPKAPEPQGWTIPRCC